MRKKKREPLEKAEHAELARKLKTAEQLLVDVTVAVQKAYGVSHPAARRLERLVKTAGPISVIRSILDDQFFRDEPHALRSPYYDARALAECEAGKLDPEIWGDVFKMLDEHK